MKDYNRGSYAFSRSISEVAVLSQVTANVRWASCLSQRDIIYLRIRRAAGCYFASGKGGTKTGRRYLRIYLTYLSGKTIYIICSRTDTYSKGKTRSRRCRHHWQYSLTSKTSVRNKYVVTRDSGGRKENSDTETMTKLLPFQ